MGYGWISEPDYRIDGKVGAAGNAGSIDNAAGNVEGDQFTGGKTVNIYNFVPPDVARDRRNRELLLAEVWEEVDGRLKSSLHGRLEALLNPEKNALPGEVQQRSWYGQVRIGS